MKIAYRIFGGFMLVLSVVFCIFFYYTYMSFSEKNISATEENMKIVSKTLSLHINNIRENLGRDALIFASSDEIKKAVTAYEANKSKESFTEIFTQKKRAVYTDPINREEVRIVLFGANGEIIYFDDSTFVEANKEFLKEKYISELQESYQTGISSSGENIFLSGIANIKLGEKKYVCLLVLPLNITILEKAAEVIGTTIGIRENDKILTTLRDRNSEYIKVAATQISYKAEREIDGKKYLIGEVSLDNSLKEKNIVPYIFKDISEAVTKRNMQMKGMIATIIVLYFGAALIMFGIMKLLFNKIAPIGSYLTKIVTKDYSFKVSQDVIKQKDEVGNIYSNIEKIKGEMQSNDEKIRHYSKELEISYKEMKNYTYIVEVKNKELIERLKEQELVKEILNRGIKELSEINRFLKFLLKKIYEYKKFKRAELIYKNSIDNAYERVSYLPENDKFIDNFYEENLKYLINERPVTKDDYMEIPIKRDKEIIGNLKIEGIELSGTTEKTIEIIANELEIILENAELYYKMDKKIIELSFLNSISVALSSITDVNELKNMINNSIGVLFGLSNYDIYVYEKGYFLDFKEMNGDIVKIKQKKVDDESLYILNKFGNIKIKKEYYIPLVIKEKLIGAIRVDDVDNFKTVDKNIIRIFLTQLSIILQNNLMYFENRKRSFDIIKALAQAIEEKDDYTRGHSQRVMSYSIKLAEKLKFTNDEIEQIRYAGILHDIGKIGISENILLKNGRLTDEEYEIIKQHPEKGYKIMSHISSLHDIAKIVKYHHERPDGKGYPEGLTGDAIPKAAKIMSIADTFDAMTSDRPYRKGLDIEIAKEELRKYKGTQFDDEIAGVFLDMLEHGEIKIEK